MINSKVLVFKTFLRLLSVSLFFSVISGCAVVPGSSAGSPFNKFFTPSLFEITFYEIGLRNSQTSARAAIFKNESGATIDLAIPASMRDLASNTPFANGNWDQVYSITSNTQRYAGGESTGCFIRQGQAFFPSPDKDPLRATKKADLSGIRSATFNSFNPFFNYLGPVRLSSTSDVVGQRVFKQQAWLVSSSNPLPNGGGVIDRILTLGDLPSPITTTPGTQNIEVSFDSTNSFEMTPLCSRFFVSNVKMLIRVRAKNMVSVQAIRYLGKILE